MEAELTIFNFTQQLIEAAAKFYTDAPPAPNLHPSGPSAARWPIFCAWCWLVRDPHKETLSNIAFSSDQAKVRKPEGPMDLVYRGVMPADFGRAIQTIETENDEASDGEEYANIENTNLAAQGADKRASLWRTQQPSIAITTTLVLGLQRMRTELRRRVDAWIALAIASSQSMTPADDSVTVPPPTPFELNYPNPTARRSS